ncbi:germination protein YpeB [Sporolactobacillus putidus]|uniref:Sporulation protein YpeB n=1 Tax=Sporolactobacillus putidus TaxID=492735 RepID=A0A917W0G6_9BACL|nr:germination protein YpeB [Sporolactobacillus putidus]GGL47008.1 sporulation protein YpeB [Sporolactobacillus putidus]
MKSRFWIILSSVFAAAMIAFGIWGDQERMAKDAVMIQAENQYQQSFHELTYYVDSLEKSLGMSLAMHTRETMRPQLVETWRLSTLAHGAANQLPLTLLPFNKTNEFLSHVGAFSYKTGVKATNDRPLSDKEYASLQKLYRESMGIRQGLRDIQENVMARHLRWMDVEWALKTKKQNQDNQVIDGLKQVDGQATSYTQSFSPENPSNAALKKKSLKKLEGPVMNKKEAASALKKWMNLTDARTSKISETGKGSNMDAYEVTLQNKDRIPIEASVTRKGGHVIWFFADRPVGKEKISLYEAANRAGAFLKKHGLTGMELTKKERYDRTAIFTYVLKRNNIRIYPASLRLKVTLDNGEVIAFDETDYLFNKYDQIPMTPKLSAKAVMKQLNPKLVVQESHLVVFQNPLLQNVLCYEFFATRGQDTYRVLLNAENGDQEKVELLRN